MQAFVPQRWYQDVNASTLIRAAILFRAIPLWATQPRAHNNVAMLWSAYHYVYWTSWLCTLSASAFTHWAIPTSARFLFRHLYGDFLFYKNLLTICYMCRLTLLQLMHHPRMCGPTNGFQQAVHSLPSKRSASVKSRLCSKQNSNGPSPENLMTIGGCFECYMYRVTVLGWLEKEKRKKKINNSDFRPFQVCHFKIVTIATADWGRLYKLLYVLLDTSICSPVMKSPCKR